MLLFRARKPVCFTCMCVCARVCVYIHIYDDVVCHHLVLPSSALLESTAAEEEEEEEVDCCCCCSSDICCVLEMRCLVEYTAGM
jgi:hypothetical protein